MWSTALCASRAKGGQSQVFGSLVSCNALFWGDSPEIDEAWLISHVYGRAGSRQGEVVRHCWQRGKPIIICSNTRTRAVVLMWEVIFITRSAARKFGAYPSTRVTDRNTRLIVVGWGLRFSWRRQRSKDPRGGWILTGRISRWGTRMPEVGAWRNFCNKIGISQSTSVNVSNDQLTPTWREIELEIL